MSDPAYAPGRGRRALSGTWVFSESYEASRFEMLALECAFTEDELRGVLRRLIAKKCGWATPRQLVRCSSWGNEFELSTRRARVHTVEGSQARCPLCSRDLTPGPSEIKWLTELPAEVRESAVAEMSALAA